MCATQRMASAATCTTWRDPLASRFREDLRVLPDDVVRNIAMAAAATLPEIEQDVVVDHTADRYRENRATLPRIVAVHRGWVARVAKNKAADIARLLAVRPSRVAFPSEDPPGPPDSSPTPTLDLFELLLPLLRVFNCELEEHRNRVTAQEPSQGSPEHLRRERSRSGYQMLRQLARAENIRGNATARDLQYRSVARSWAGAAIEMAGGVTSRQVEDDLIVMHFQLQSAGVAHFVSSDVGMQSRVSDLDTRVLDWFFQRFSRTLLFAYETRPGERGEPAYEYLRTARRYLPRIESLDANVRREVLGRALAEGAIPAGAP